MNGYKSWVMVILTLVFVVLYTVALLGWLKPLSDVTMVMRLEPIIFVIIGYYFGRLPAQQNEDSLKEEISRQSKKADAAQSSREQTRQEREAIEEKLKNVKTILTPLVTRDFVKSRAEIGVKTDENNNLQVLQQSVKIAANILNS
jgi:Ca2+/Na+ antiporter